MPRRALSLLVLLLLLSSLPASAQVRQGRAQRSSRGPVTALVAVSLPDAAARARFQAAGLPAYARLYGRGGAYVLTIADPAGRAALTAAGLAFRLLDADTFGATYVLAYAGTGPVNWPAYGQTLLDDGVQVLLRTTPDQSARLEQAGLRVRPLSLEPRPLPAARPRNPLPDAVVPDPYVRLMMDQVISSTLYDYVGGLSGEWPVQVGGEPYTIATRYTYSGEPIQKATQYVGDHLAALGLDVEYHVWGGAGYPNVIGELPGLVNPDDIFIICAHLDSYPPGTPSPGADDDASGSAAVLLAADILTQYRWGSTLRFVLFTGEEQWMLGSYAYAERSYNAGENLVGVLDLDMVAWNTLGSPRTMDMESEPSVPGSVEIAELFSDVLSAYDIDLVPEILYGGAGDHIAFWEYGYPSIMAIEDWDDFNPRYHTPQERLAYFDMPYYTDMVKAALGTFVHMAGSLIPGGLGALDGHVAAFGGGPVEGAAVGIADPAGHAYATATDPSGYYTRTLFPGPYTVTVSAYGYLPTTATNVLVVTDTVTTQDFTLTLAPAHVVSGTVRAADTGLPLAARVTFLGTPVVVFTDPATGYYSATVTAGAYTMRARAARHRSEERAVVVDHDQTQDFALEAMPAVLVVDDDMDGPDVRSYYTAPLDALQVDYAVWDINWAGDPAAGNLADYAAVVWFTGQPWGLTLNGANEAALGAYLEDGGRLLLSSADYLYDVGLTYFGQHYLGIASYTDNVLRTDPVGNAGHPVGDGLGPFTLIPPPGWDPLRTDAVQGVQPGPLRWLGTGQDNSTVYDGGGFRTVFLAWPLEGLAGLQDRADLLRAALGWFGGCYEEGTLAGRVAAAESGQPLPGAGVWTGLFTATTDVAGRYTLTLPAGTHLVTAAYPGYLSQTVVQPITAGLTLTRDFSLSVVPVGCDPVHDIAFAWSPFTPTVGEQVAFTATATGTLPISYGWKLDVGSWKEGVVVTYSYSLPGAHAVILTATNCATATSAAAYTITVLPPPCDPVQIVTVTWTVSGCAVALGAELTGTAPFTYLWQAGPLTSTLPEPVFDFGASGAYTVTLTAGNCGGEGAWAGAVQVECSAPAWRLYLPVVFR